jgi:hypothetical protein
VSDRVSAKIVIGGRAPAASLDALLDAIETEGLGPDWGEVFDDRPGMLAHIRANIDGVELCADQVAHGEFPHLQALCARLGLSYRLVYDGFGSAWGPAIRLRHAGIEETCSLDADGGAPCVSRADILGRGLDTRDAILAHLDRFAAFRPGRLVLEDDAAAIEGGVS